MPARYIPERLSALRSEPAQSRPPHHQQTAPSPSSDVADQNRKHTQSQNWTAHVPKDKEQFTLSPMIQETTASKKKSEKKKST